MYKVQNIDIELFCDSCIVDTLGQVVFTSLWGRTASIQAFLGQVTSEQLKSFTLSERSVGLTRFLDKKIVKIDQSNCFGDLNHMFIFKNKDKHIKYVFANNDFPNSKQIWEAVKALSKLPLLDEWADKLTEQLFLDNYLTKNQTISGNIYSISVTLPQFDEYKLLITNMIHLGNLRII